MTMKCPQCGGDIQVVGKFFICPDHGPVTLAAEESVPLAASGELQQLVLERFPFAIAYGYRGVVELQSASHAVECAFYTYTALLRYSALVFLSQFLGAKVQNPQAAIAVQRLRMPALENWFTGLYTLAKRLFVPLPGQELRFASYAEGGPFAPQLVAAARRLSKLESGGSPVHERIRNLRNERAHGAPWDEAECQRRLPEIRTLLDAALDLFRPLADVVPLRASPSGMVRLVGAKETFPEHEIVEPRLADLFEESEMVLRNDQGDLLPLYPLFLGGSEKPMPQGYTEPLLIFDGHNQKSVAYLGVRGRSERQDMLGRYLDLLRAKDIDPRFTKADLAPWNVTQWAREASLGTVDNLRGVKYFPEFYTERRAAAAPTPKSENDGEDEVSQGVDDALAHWLERGREAALIVAAEAGSGKTSLFCHLSEKLLESGSVEGLEPRDQTDCVLLILGGSVRGKATLFERIREGLGFSDDLAKGGVGRFDELLTTWLDVGEKEDLDHDRRRILILLDAANEADDPKAVFEELSELAAMAASANRRTGRGFVRLLISVRTERLETLLERWQERHDTPFLNGPENFAHFPDRSGKPSPFLELRSFTPTEARATYLAAQSTLVPASCPATWEQLAVRTRELLRQPLLLRLFHAAYAGNPQPPAVGSVDTVWDIWLDQSFDVRQGGAALEGLALDFADACIDGGHDSIPLEISAAGRRAWQAEQGNDPIRIAAGIDPLERLTEAGLLREGESGGLDWVSDSLAEQVVFRALRRRDPALKEESLATWLGLKPTARLDGAIVRAGIAIWDQQRPLGLRPLLSIDLRRGPALLGRILLGVAPPRGPDSEVTRFAEMLDLLVDWVEEEGSMRLIDHLNTTLRWYVASDLVYRFGVKAVLAVVLSRNLRLAKTLANQEPGNTKYQRDLSSSFDMIGDPDQAREWYLKRLPIVEKLAHQEPDNTEFQLALSFSYTRIGDLDNQRDPDQARAWYLKSLRIAERLAEQEPDNTEFQLALSLSYTRIGDLDNQRDPDQARAWYLKSLPIAERLAKQEAENTLYLSYLTIFFNSIGNLDRQRDPDQARAWYLKSLEICQKLTALEPENTEYLDYLRNCFDNVGYLYEQSDPDQAREWYLKSLEIDEKLAELEPDIYLSGLSSSYDTIGNLEEQRDPDKARAWYLKSLEISEKLAALEPDHTGHQFGLYYQFLHMGRLDEQRDPDQARAWYLKSLRIAERLAEQEPDNTEYQRYLAHLQSILGRMRAAGAK